MTAIFLDQDLFSRTVVALPDIRCRLCGSPLKVQYWSQKHQWVYRHPEVDELVLSWDWFTADFFCLNNAKIWVLEPDMVVLREI